MSASRTSAVRGLSLSFLVVSIACAVAAADDPPPPPLPEDATASPASPTLHARLDTLISTASPGFADRAADLCPDAEFVRRVYLDLAGTIPSAAVTRDFLADSTSIAQKREQLIDRLLASPQHARRMQYVFDEMLMERRAGTTVPVAEWQNWLRQAFLDNKPWNELVQEVLEADGVDKEKRPAAKFYLDRNLDVDLLTRDIGRVFLGVDLECAQCHDHPSIDGYLQRHYYGITAFLKRSYLFTDPKSKQKVLGEKAEGDVKFTSVFTQEEGATPPRLLDLPAIVDPEGTEKQYEVKPDGKNRGVPKYSRRLQLAGAMISADNIDFRRNIVNRLWAVMMGRGLVEPLDLRHSDNPPTHPQVLDLLADEFLSHNYDVRWLLRELALSETYQRGSRPQTNSDAASTDYSSALLKSLSPEQLAWSVMESSGVTTQTLAAQQAALLKSDVKNGPKKKDDPLWQEETLHKTLKPHVDEFALQFAHQGGQKTGLESTANQALFLINGSLVQGWLTPANGNLTDRLRKLDDNVAVAEELYVSLLNRIPTGDEVADVTAYLEAVSERDPAIQEIVWAVLASAEFRFNH